MSSFIQNNVTVHFIYLTLEGNVSLNHLTMCVCPSSFRENDIVCKVNLTMAEASYEVQIETTLFPKISNNGFAYFLANCR